MKGRNLQSAVWLTALLWIIAITVCTCRAAEPTAALIVTCPAEVVRVIDGDTVICHVDLGMDVTLIDQPVRVLGYDAPETRRSKGVTIEEVTAGIAAREYLTQRLPVGTRVILHIERKNPRDHFGRILAIVLVSDENGDWKRLDHIMRDLGHVKPTAP